MTRAVDIKLERERVAFAERAAMHFADHPEHWTYADGREEFYASCRKVLEEYSTGKKDVKHCADTALAKGKDND